MTSPLPIIVDSEDRGMKRPVEEVARVIGTEMDRDFSVWLERWTYPGGLYSDAPAPPTSRYRVTEERLAMAVLKHLVQLGFLNDNYFVAKKAEEAGDEVRKTQ